MTGIKARPTLYKGIRMRSRLEAHVAAQFDASGCTWEYEAECFAADGVQWLPDFRLSNKPPVFIEVKPAGFLELRDGETSNDDVVQRVDGLLRQMSVAWDSDRTVWVELEFWTYDAPYPDLRILGMRGQPWLAWEGTWPLLWQGMGQYEAVDERAQALFGLHRHGKPCPCCHPAKAARRTA